MQINYDISNYTLEIQGGALKKFCVTTVLVVLLTYFLSSLVPSDNALDSLIGFTLVGLVPVWLYSKLLLNDSMCSMILIIAYIVKAIWGIFHYLYFIDPAYFLHPDSVALNAVTDFSSMFMQIEKYVDGFDFTYTSILDNAIMPHPEIYALMSIFYKTAGCYLLTIVPINIISSCLTATMIGYITKVRSGNFQIVTFLCAFFPMSLISSLFFRDLFGMMLVTIALCLFVFSKNVFKYIALIFASFVFGLQRGPYLIVPILAYVIYLFLKPSANKGLSRIIALFVSVFALAAGSDYLLGSFDGSEVYMGTSKNTMFYLLFPIRLIQCFAGPFPWTQVLDRPENTFQFQDWFMSSALFYMLFRVFPQFYNNIKNRKQLDYVSIVGLLLMFMGIISSTPHLTYVAFGIPFIIPMISTIDFSFRDFFTFNLKYFIIMAILSFVWSTAGFGGTSAIFK